MIRSVFCSLLFLTFFSVGALAQSYCPLPDSNALWKNYYFQFLANSNSGQITVNDFLQGDTVIGSQTYHKVYEHRAYQQNYGPATFSYNIYSGAYRNDSINRRVYFVPPSATTDTVLYDFNITVGGTLPVTYIDNNSFTVTSIDSVFFRGKWHRRYHTGQTFPNSMEYQWIEGIGSTGGFINQFYNGAGFRVLLCASVENDPVWPDTVNFCVGMVDVREASEIKNSIRISPIPATNSVTIQFSPDYPAERTIELLDVNGHIVMTRNSNESSLALDLSELDSGIYFLRETNQACETVHQKIIVQH